MSNHTPGPWFVEQSEKTPVYVSPVDRDEQIAICNVMVIDEHPEDDSGEWFNGEQTKANARLIAASPDLLEALESFPGFDTGSLKYERDWLVKMVAAIARAKGEK